MKCPSIIFMADEITLKEAIGNREGIKVNLNKLREEAKKCKEQKDNDKCRRELSNIGIEFID